VQKALRKVIERLTACLLVYAATYIALSLALDGPSIRAMLRGD
jgi:hypothetical protein